ncbi:MAG: DNA repair protein RecO [Deltaproteobacteria bacterium]|nr:DNA repair protein RecO [Deltaproteobacteria bacterium]NCP96458.1 DNA repair protein RecO [Deltaproteobacteria bacterium]NCS72604.1 DNA repair protein RecO [Deltaproteobacteria bacterium]
MSRSTGVAVALFRDQVVVLTLYPYRDRDRVVHTLARDHGRLGLLARGARSPRGVLAPRLMVGNWLEVTYHRGPHASLGTLREVSLVADHQGLQGDLDAFACLEVMVEVADHLGHEGSSEPALFDALCAGLAALEGGAGRRGLVVFLVAALAASGLWGAGDRCEHCGRPWAGEIRELAGEGHALWCEPCGGERGRPFPLGLLLALVRIASPEGERVVLTREQEVRAIQWLTGRIEAQSRRRLKSAAFLNGL